MEFKEKEIVNEISGLQDDDLKSVDNSLSKTGDRFRFFYDDKNICFKIVSKGLENERQFLVEEITINDWAVKKNTTNGRFPLTQQVSLKEVKFFPQHSNRKNKKIVNYLSNLEDEIIIKEDHVEIKDRERMSVKDFSIIQMKIIIAKLKFVADVAYKPEGKGHFEIEMSTQPKVDIVMTSKKFLQLLEDELIKLVESKNEFKVKDVSSNKGVNKTIQYQYKDIGYEIIFGQNPNGRKEDSLQDRIWLKELTRTKTNYDIEYKLIKDKNLIKKNNQVVLTETYSMTVGTPKPTEVVRNNLLAKGFNLDGEIVSFDEQNIDKNNWAEIFEQLFEWIRLRIEVKRDFEKYNTADDIDNQPNLQPPNKTNMPTTSLNTILYGPPGTGKTYNTVNKAIQIANPAFELEKFKDNRQTIKAEYDRLVKEGRIVFTTFHQSMSYEDFIEGIKPLKPNDGDAFVKYDVTDGVFKSLSKKAGLTSIETIEIDNAQAEFTKEMFADFYSAYVERLPSTVIDRSDYKLKTKEGSEFELFKNSANSIVVRAGEKRTNQSVALSELINVLFNDKKPTYASYENVIIDEILEGRVVNDTATDNSKKNYVLIIDEINRGNVSSIFGELITLIEESKRRPVRDEDKKNCNETIEVTLPYSKESFSVPSNLYIIGTMNTADRSVEALDSALRRRFEFEEMMPKYEVLKDKNVAGISLRMLLEKINNRIEALLDRDHLIGHAYFCDVNDANGLVHAFQNKIIPLLQEYFYGNYQNIELVLGRGFVTSQDFKIEFAVPENAVDLDGKKNFSFVELNQTNIVEAINVLLGKSIIEIAEELPSIVSDEQVN